MFALCVSKYCIHFMFVQATIHGWTSWSEERRQLCFQSHWFPVFSDQFCLHPEWSDWQASLLFEVMTTTAVYDWSVSQLRNDELLWPGLNWRRLWPHGSWLRLQHWHCDGCMNGGTLNVKDVSQWFEYVKGEMSHVRVSSAGLKDLTSWVLLFIFIMRLLNSNNLTRRLCNVKMLHVDLTASVTTVRTLPHLTF